MLRRIGQLMRNGRGGRNRSGRQRIYERNDRMKRDRFRLQSFEMPGLHICVAAIVRSRHVHAAASALHLATAAMLLWRHLGIWESTDHGWRKQ